MNNDVTCDNVKCEKTRCRRERVNIYKAGLTGQTGIHYHNYLEYDPNEYE